MHEEEKHIDIREKLLNLPKVKASDDFVNSLQRKINLEEAESGQKKVSDEVKESIWVKLFGKNRNPWLIPSLSLSIVAILIISIYVLNSGKLNDVPTVSDFQKENKQENTVLQEKQDAVRDIEESTEKNDKIIAKRESEKIVDESAPVHGKELNDQFKIQPVTPDAKRDVDKVSAPQKTDDSRIETGKTEIKKEEVINKEAERKINEEKVAPVESSTIKGNEAEQKISTDEKNKDAIESKGLIEKKEKMSMKKSGKNTTDSTKIDKKILERIKEELEKSIEEKK